MRSKNLNAVMLGLLAVLASASTPRAWADIVHTATPANTQAHITYLDMPYANGNPSRLLIVTPIWNPTPGAGTYNDHPIGVWYDASRGRWAVFNQDLAAMPTGASFYVYDGPPGESFAVQRCGAANIRDNSCYVDNPLANGRPDALVFITANWNPGGSGGVYNSHHTGVWYDGGAGRWAVFNQDRSAMPPDAAFNVLIRRPDSALFVHRASAANVTGNSTYVDALVKRPPADVGWLWVTPNWNPGGGGGGYFDHAFGVWYDAGRGQWAIFSQDRQPMPAGVSFNVLMQLVP